MFQTTRLNSFDNENLTTSNGDLANAAVTNSVANDTLRLTYDFGISYDDSSKLAQRLITDVGDSLNETLSEPAPSTLVTDPR
nr:mechanosensitive ion channel family protein [Haloferax profundi]